MSSWNLCTRQEMWQLYQQSEQVDWAIHLRGKVPIGVPTATCQGVTQVTSE
jgi:hypothetical protein